MTRTWMIIGLLAGCDGSSPATSDLAVADNGDMEASSDGGGVGDVYVTGPFALAGDVLLSPDGTTVTVADRSAPQALKAFAADGTFLANLGPAASPAAMANQTVYYKSSDGALHVWRQGQTQNLALSNTYLSISDDGERVAWDEEQAPGQFGLFWGAFRGTDFHLFPVYGDFVYDADHPPLFSHGSGHLFTPMANGLQDSSGRPLYDLARIGHDDDSSTMQILMGTHVCSSCPNQFALSSDGNQIAAVTSYSNNANAVIGSTDGSAPTSAPFQLDSVRPVGFVDGTHDLIYFTSVAVDMQYVLAIHHYTAAGQDSVITEIPEAVAGLKLLFATSTSVGFATFTETQLWTVPLAGGTPIQLSARGQFMESRPNGRMLFWDRTSGARVVGDPDGTLTQIPGVSASAGGARFADDDHVIYTFGEQLSIFDLTAKSSTPVASPVDGFGYSASTRRLAYVSHTSGLLTIHVLP